MHKESKEALLNAEKKCRECLSILKNTSWAIEDNCSEETIDAMESAYQKSVDVLLSIELPKECFVVCTSKSSIRRENLCGSPRGVFLM